MDRYRALVCVYREDGCRLVNERRDKSAFLFLLAAGNFRPLSISTGLYTTIFFFSPV